MDNKLPIFSIIVPVYNTENYLHRCINSILSQGFSDFELILVDDGSTDNSGEICDTYAKQDDRIKIFHQANKGLSGARNTGLEAAKGEWIAFVDSDDWVESNYLETINRKIQLINGDLYTFGLRRLNAEKIHYEYCPPYTVENNNSFIKSKYYKHTGCTYVFNNSIIKKWNINFPTEMKQYTEDQPFLLKYISKCNKIVLINKILYNYYLNPNSITQQSVNIAWAISKIQATNDFLQFCKQNNVDKIFYEHPVKQLYEDFFTYYKMIKKVNRKEVQKEYRKAYKKTLQLYPELKKYRFFKFANYSLSFPETLLQRKQQIKKFMSIFRKLKNIKQALINAYEVKDIIKTNNTLIIKELECVLISNNLKYRCLTLKEMGITTEKYFENDVIVSLTSYGKRIYDVYLTIESLMEQTIKPNKIILWLAEDEFTMENIPQTLKNLQNRGLIIEFCEDIKSYKKLVPALKKYPDDIIITVDDDVIYQHDLIENLLNSYRKNPELIHFYRGHRMKFKNDNSLENYIKWSFYINDYEINKLNFPTGAGGILYPPNTLHQDVTNDKIFLLLAPHADDVWFKTMSLLQGTLSRKVFTRSSKGQDYIDLNDEIQTETALWNINIVKNDEQIKAVFNRYNIYKLLK